MRKFFCAVLVLAMVLALLPSAMAEQKPQLYVLAVDYTEDNAGLFDAFEQANNCEVVLVPVKSEDFLAYFTVVANGGAQVDVIDINGQDVRGLSQKGMLMDLTGKVDYLDRFYDAVEGRGADPIPPEQILRVCRVIDQIVEGVDACMADPKNSTSATEARA